MEYVKEAVLGPRIERSDSKEIAPNHFMPDGSVGPDHLHNQQGVMLLGVGNPLLDISSKVSMDVLEKYEVERGRGAVFVDCYRVSCNAR